MPTMVTEFHFGFIWQRLLVFTLKLKVHISYIADRTLDPR